MNNSTEIVDFLTDFIESSVFEFTFDSMELAEELIELTIRENPTQEKFLNMAFLVLRPRREIFSEYSPLLIRSHMNELLERIVLDGEKADVGLGTNAEMCVAFMELALKAPLKHEYFVSSCVVFLDAMGESQFVNLLGEESMRRTKEDRNNYQIIEILQDLRNQRVDSNRQSDWKNQVLRLKNAG